MDLPDLFEQSIQLSEVKKQDIQNATAELNKVRIEMDTKIKSAEFQKDVAIVNSLLLKLSRMSLKERLAPC